MWVGQEKKERLAQKFDDLFLLPIEKNAIQMMNGILASQKHMS
jgi:hypothetical protein